jgi:hypothetical protein
MNQKAHVTRLPNAATDALPARSGPHAQYGTVRLPESPAVMRLRMMHRVELCKPASGAPAAGGP